MGKKITKKHAAKLARKSVRKATRYQALQVHCDRLYDIHMLLEMCEAMVDSFYPDPPDLDLEEPCADLQSRFTDLVGAVETLTGMFEERLYGVSVEGAVS